MAEWDFDEDVGGPRTEKNLVSVDEDGMWHAATYNAWPWVSSTVAGKVAVPSIYPERLFRKCKADSTTLTTLKFTERCLDTTLFMKPAATLLESNDFLVTQDDDDNEVPMVFDDEAHILEEADRLVISLIDDPALQVNDGSFDWLEGFANRAGTLDTQIAWFADGVTLEMLTQTSGDLYQYSELKMIVGHHATEVSRVDPTGIFFAMVGGANGGQLAEAIKNFYFAGSTAAMHPSFLLMKLPSFLEESRWPWEFNFPLKNIQDYAYDLAARGSFMTVSRPQLAVMLQPKMPKAVEQFSLIWTAMEDYMSTPSILTKVVEALGHQILPSNANGRSPLLQLTEIEDALESNFKEFLQAEAHAGETSDTMMRRLTERIRALKQERDADKGSSSKTHEDDYRAPKLGQVQRALGEKVYVQLETEYFDDLKSNSMNNEKKLEMLEKAFAGGSVMAKAVLMNTKGMRISVYISCSGADYLALLHGERHLLPLYWGQTLAYDKDSGGVPKELTHFTLSQQESDKISDLEWTKRARLNEVILRIKAAEAGTTFDEHSEATLYHTGEMIAIVTELDDKLYTGMGYPGDVTEEEGVTYRRWMSHIKKIQKYAVGLASDEQKQAFIMIDRFMQEGTEAAAQNFGRVVYGPTPADRKLRAWVPADAKVLIELLELVESLEEATTWRRKTGTIFGAKPKAAPLAGFQLVGGKNKVPTDGEPPKGKPGKKRSGKKGKGTKPEPKTSAPPASKATGGAVTVGGYVEKKRIFPYANGDYSIGEPATPPTPPIAQEGPRAPARSRAFGRSGASTSRHDANLTRS